MKVLVTGATGFVGAPLTELLVSEGHDVIALVPPDEHPWRLSENARARVRSIVGVVQRPDAFATEVRAEAPELCIHLAWCAEPGKYLSSSANLDFLMGTAQLATLLATSGCRRFVGVGTCFEYDLRFGLLSEETPLAPQHLYSAAKAATWMLLTQLGRQSGMEIAWPRLFYLYGPAEDPRRLVSSVIGSLLAGAEARTTRGEQVRDFLHVEDAAAALLAIACSALVGPVNVGSGVPVTVARLVSDLGRIVGRPDLVRIGALPYAAGDPMFVCANTALLRSATAWVPRYTLESGLENVVEWWRMKNQQKESV